MTGRRPAVAVVAAIAATILLGACRVDVDVAVALDTAGAGRVSVTVAVDAAAAAQVADLASLLDLKGLQENGWWVDGPAPTAGGGLRIEAAKQVRSLAEARVALAELSGPAGPFGGLRLNQDRTAFGTRTQLTGQVDLAAGLAGFGDAALREQLGSLPLGLDPSALERELGQPLAEVLDFSLRADLPGRSAAVQGTLGGSVPVDISGHRVDARRVALAVVSAGTGAGLVALLWRRRRPRGRHVRS